MVEQYITGIIPESRIDSNHYKKAWQLAMKNISSETLKTKLQVKGVICSPRSFSLDNISEKNRTDYIYGAEKNTVCFIDNYNTFYADSFMTFIKMTTFSRWVHSVNNLVNTPLHAVKNEEWKMEEFLMVWMFKHNINYTMIKSIAT
jgi:hypothetical protein